MKNLTLISRRIALLVGVLVILTRSFSDSFPLPSIPAGRRGGNGPFLIRCNTPGAATAIYGKLPSREAQEYHLTTDDNQEEEESFCVIRAARETDLRPMSKILTDEFFGHRTNIITYQWERLVTHTESVAIC